MSQFGVDPVEVFGRNATAKALRNLIDHVDGWLNGKVFPLALTGRQAPSAAQVRRVAGVFLGDDADTGQLHLDFRAYDFSYIPVETLSVIYEQFLAAEHRTKTQGAYYTPLALVNFVLAQLEDLRPLARGTTVLDPSCGSGAFLVQCYRRLIDREIRERGRDLRPPELRELLVRHVFGVDRDGDACRVTELSLLLTMLDYVDPPDLLGSAHAFKLPRLRDTNIFEGDFFDPDGAWARERGEARFHWIVGNPPWTKVSARNGGQEPLAREWIAARAKSRPIAGGRIAEAFAWKVLDHAAADAAIGLLLPAMTLVSSNAAFRDEFFAAVEVVAVANFTNLREMLFAGRSREPTAALFYRPRESPSSEVREILVFSPLVANQEITRPPGPGTRTDTWTITVNRSELRTLTATQAARSARAWHLAMWGSARDRHLLGVVEAGFPRLEEVVEDRGLTLSEGLQLRTGDADGVEPLPEVVGEGELLMPRLRKLGRIHAFPAGAIETLPAARAYVRRGRGRLPLAVCRPPHVVVSATRNWAVYTDEFLIVPPRQIGLAGGRRDRDLLRAFALYLSSDFVRYHQFFDATQSVVRDGLATLASFKNIPTPLGQLDAPALARWAELHRAIVAAEVDSSRDGSALAALERDLDAMVAEALGLSRLDRVLVSDLVDVRMALVDGRIGEAAVGPPSEDEVATYARGLGEELDGFLEPGAGLGHRIFVTTEGSAGVVEITLGPGPGPLAFENQPDAAAARAARHRRLAELRSQWIYFDRNSLVFAGDSAFLFKPMQRLWWTRSQAGLDADEIIAATLTSGGPS